MFLTALSPGQHLATPLSFSHTICILHAVLNCTHDIKWERKWNTCLISTGKMDWNQTWTATLLCWLCMVKQETWSPLWRWAHSVHIHVQNQLGAIPSHATMQPDLYCINTTIHNLQHKKKAAVIKQLTWNWAYLVRTCIKDKRIARTKALLEILQQSRKHRKCVFVHSYVNFFPATPVFLFGLAFIYTCIELCNNPTLVS